MLHSSKIFLVDSLGACFSAVLLGLVFANHNDFIGMPTNSLFVLAGIALLFACYSSICYFVSKENWQRLLTVIAYANLCYCCLTIGLMLYYSSCLTTWGLIYFLAEVAVIVTLALVELRMAKRA